MLNEHLRAAVERAAELPTPMQEEIAAIVEEALQRMTQPAPQLSQEWRPSVERVMQEQAETLDYLKDK